MNSGTSVTWQGLEPVAASAVPQPTTGRVLFHDIADGLLKSKDSAGTIVVIVETNAAGVIVGPVSVRNLTEANTNLTAMVAGEIAWTSDYGQIRLADGVVMGGIAGNMASSTTVLCPAIGTPAENGAAFLAAKVRAEALLTAGAGWVEIITGVGRYLLPTALAWDTSLIGIRGVGKAYYNRETDTATYPDTIFEFTTGDFVVSCRNTRISGIQLVGGNIDLDDTTNGNDQTILSNIGTDESFIAQTTVPVQCAIYDSAVLGMIFSSNSHAGCVKRVVAGSTSLNLDTSGVYIDLLVLGAGVSGIGNATASGLYARVEMVTPPSSVASFGGGGGVFSGVAIDCVGADNSFGGSGGTTSGQLYNCKIGHLGLGTTSATTKLYDCLIETGSGTGVYEYIPENTKRLAIQPTVSETGKDLASGYTIEWLNPHPTGVIIDTKIDLSGLANTSETFSVAVKIDGSPYPGSSTFSSTKKAPTATTSTLNIPTSLGTVGVGETIQWEIVSDNAGSTSCGLDLTATEMAYI